MTRQPSEWMRPRSRQLGLPVAEVALPVGQSDDGASCLRPGPCWGNRQGQCFENEETSTHAPSRRSWTDARLDGMTSAIASRQAAMISG